MKLLKTVYLFVLQRLKAVFCDHFQKMAKMVANKSQEKGLSIILCK